MGSPVPIHESTITAEVDGVTLPPARGLERYGPTIVAIVGKVAAEGAPQPGVPPVQTVALIDTGATTSCIDEKLAQKLSLPVIDRRYVGGVGGRKKHNVYMAHMVVPALRLESKGAFLGVDLSAYQPVLLGRDFLANIILTYNGPSGRITLAV